MGSKRVEANVWLASSSAEAFLSPTELIRNITDMVWGDTTTVCTASNNASCLAGVGGLRYTVKSGSILNEGSCRQFGCGNTQPLPHGQSTCPAGRCEQCVCVAEPPMATIRRRMQIYLITF